ncbi:class V lanthionine synthetase subunit LxmK [Nocardia sp. CA-290969]|uniref:class V lanthionine synthetase subunit LxmK n=1 Tax=Nocardia sp. CA-290969 TaxID=3239986 RepID=UPI003D918162
MTPAKSGRVVTGHHTPRIFCARFGFRRPDRTRAIRCLPPQTQNFREFGLVVTTGGVLESAGPKTRRPIGNAASLSKWSRQQMRLHSSETVGNHTPSRIPTDVRHAIELVSTTGRGPANIQRLPGRNLNFVAESGDRKFFVKVLDRRESTQRIEALLAFERFNALPSVREWYRGPQLIDVDTEHNAAVFEYIGDRATGSELMVDMRFDTKTAGRVGELLGRLHRSSHDHVPISAPNYPAPRPQHLHAIPLDQLYHLTEGEIEAFRNCQKDHELTRLLEELIADSESNGDRCPIHGDVRVDQLLIDDETVMLIDWEEFRIGDPARDVGTFIGEWLYRTILDIPTGRGDGTAFRRTGDSSEIVSRAVDKAAVLAPLVQEFWRSYTAVTHDSADPALLRRACRFAGWHLIDRLFAFAAGVAVLPATHWAAAGVGRAALGEPDGVIDLFELKVPA